MPNVVTNRRVLLNPPRFTAAPFVGALDAYKDHLSGAWSEARRLLASYFGYAFSVRADRVGQPTMDIPYLPDGDLDTATLLAFAGSDSVYVVTLYDQAGNGYHATQVLAASQPKIVDAGVLITLSGKPAMLFDGIDDSLPITTLQTTAVKTYACVMKSTGATWNNYGAPIGNSAGFISARLGLTNTSGTDWFGVGSIPVAVRRSGVALTTPFDTAPINVPFVLGLDCSAAVTDPQATNMGSVEGLFWLAASISETVAWSSVADRTAFEANQKAYFGI